MADLPSAALLAEPGKPRKKRKDYLTPSERQRMTAALAAPTSGPNKGLKAYQGRELDEGDEELTTMADDLEAIQKQRTR